MFSILVLLIVVDQLRCVSTLTGANVTTDQNVTSPDPTAADSVSQSSLNIHSSPSTPLPFTGRYVITSAVVVPRTSSMPQTAAAAATQNSTPLLLSNFSETSPWPSDALSSAPQPTSGVDSTHSPSSSSSSSVSSIPNQDGLQTTSASPLFGLESTTVSNVWNTTVETGHSSNNTLTTTSATEESLSFTTSNVRACCSLRMTKN